MDVFDSIIENMTEKEVEAFAAEHGVKCMNSFYHFFLTFWSEMSGEQYVDAPHIKYLCDTLQYWGEKVIQGEKIMKTVVINVPPGSSKSTIATIAFPMWTWLHAPNLATANISYSATLSAGHAFKARGITESAKWHVLFDNIFTVIHGKPLEIIQQNSNKMVNNFKGERFNTSVRGTILGMHADIFIKDDLISADQATSDVEREKANEWNDETTTSRRKNPSCYLDIYIAQRLHENDICGHVLNKPLDITHICLPAEVTMKNSHVVQPKSAMSLYTDGVLDPNRRPKDVLDILEIEMGTSGYTGQYLQTPFDLEKQPIKPSMFELVDPRDDMVWDLWIDGAYTEKTENDPTGITVLGYKDHTLYVKHSYNVYMELPDVISFIKELAELEVFDPRKGRIFIEPKATGYSLSQYIEAETDLNFVLIGQGISKGEKDLVSQGKTARHNMIKPKAQSERIKLFKGDWNDQFITQLSGFPRAAHDEQVDIIGYAVNHYFLKEKSFIKEYVMRIMQDRISGFLRANITSHIDRYKISAGYQYLDDGDVQLFNVPNELYNNRYICVLVLRTEAARSGHTTILVYDRLDRYVAALYTSPDIEPEDAGMKALELATLYNKAKLVVAMRDESGVEQTEDIDLAHLALAKIRHYRYLNIYANMTYNDIKKTREKEYGFKLDKSAMREIFYGLKTLLEKDKIKEVPREIYDQIPLIERRKEDGSIDIMEGHEGNAITAYSVALKIADAMREEPRPRRTGDQW